MRIREQIESSERDPRFTDVEALLEQDLLSEVVNLPDETVDSFMEKLCELRWLLPIAVEDGNADGQKADADEKICCLWDRR